METPARRKKRKVNPFLGFGFQTLCLNFSLQEYIRRHRVYPPPPLRSCYPLLLNKELAALYE